MVTWRRRAHRKDPDDYTLEDFTRDLEDELDSIEYMFNELRRRLIENRLENIPYVYGFSMKLDEDGKPIIESFGNLNDFLEEEVEAPDKKEYLTDVIDGEKEVTVMAEIPGTTKEDIDIRIEDRTLKITAATPEGIYRKGVKLPCKVKPETAKAVYNNGVLELRVDRLETKKRRGHRVRVQ